MEVALANALETYAEQRWDNQALEQSVATYQEVLKEYTREHTPLAWAATLNNLGNALYTLGERESGTERLTQAVTTYQEALKEYTQEHSPYHHDITARALEYTRQAIEKRKGTARSYAKTIHP